MVDAHVHVFPHEIFSSVQAWFDRFAWKIRYRAKSEDLIRFLLDHGIDHVVALQYAHKPGMAEFLNRYRVDLCDQFPGRLTGLATVFPGKDQAESILCHAFDQGLGGVKLHVHVQCFDMNSPAMEEICQVCQAQDKPIVIHAGQEPKSDQYRCDPYEICRADKIEALVKNFPRLNICVPHLGFGELTAYQQLIETHDNLWLDTAMVLTDYFPFDEKVSLAAIAKTGSCTGLISPTSPMPGTGNLSTFKRLGAQQGK